MNSLTFTCEIITPMFLNGADGKTPELRPPSIKGALRFWWRALNGHLSLDDLRKQEAEIFGGTDEKVGRSKIVIRTSHSNLHQERFNMLPHKKDNESPSPPQAYEPSQTFTVTLALTSTRKNFDLDKLESLFVLTCLLGGLGKRSRRGFGAIWITEKDNNIFSMPNTLNGENGILNLIKKFNPHYAIDNPTTPNKIQLKKPSPLNGQYSNDYPYIEEIYIGHTPKSYLDLVKGIGSATHHHKDNSNGSANPRFASPVYISAIKDGNNVKSIVTKLNYANQKSTPTTQKQSDLIKDALK
jgi:CRISPR-associated protein Cmr1